MFYKQIVAVHQIKMMGWRRVVWKTPINGAKEQGSDRKWIWDLLVKHTDNVKFTDHEQFYKLKRKKLNP